MDYVHEDADGEESVVSELSLASQQALIRDADTVPGIAKFGDALVRGQLSKFIPLHLDGANQYVVSEYDEKQPRRTDIGGRDKLHYRLTSTGFWPEERAVSIELRIDPATEKPLTVSAVRRPSPTSQPKTGNRGLSMDLHYKLAGTDMKFDQGVVYVQTSTEKLAPITVVVIGPDGQVTDVLPAGDYQHEKDFGEVLRRADEESRLGGLASQGTHSLDQLKASFAEHGTKLAHERSPIDHSELQTEVANFLGMTVSELFTAKVDPVATFDQVMNAPFNIKPALHGEGEASVPPIVFKSR